MPLEPAVPMFAIVACSALEVTSIQIFSPPSKPVTLATLITGNFAPARRERRVVRHGFAGRVRPGQAGRVEGQGRPRGRGDRRRPLRSRPRRVDDVVPAVVRPVALATTMWVASVCEVSVVALPTSVVPSTLPAPSVATGPPTGPTALQVLFVPSCSSDVAFAISAAVSGGDSNCAIRLSTAGVYGAAASTDGEVVVAGSVTGACRGRRRQRRREPDHGRQCCGGKPEERMLTRSRGR